jgi:hypothetical protein
MYDHVEPSRRPDIGEELVGDQFATGIRRSLAGEKPA